MKALAFAALAFTFASCLCCKSPAAAPAPAPAPAAKPASGGPVSSAPESVPMATIVAAPAAATAPVAHAAAAAGDKPTVYDELADAKKDIAAAVGRASAENRRVLIQWGGNWCGWCIKLHDLYGKDAKIRRELMYEYDVVYVDSNHNLELATAYGAGFAQPGSHDGVPYLTVLDGQGKVLANQATGPLESGEAHDPAKVLAFLQSQKPTYWKADELLAQSRAKAAQEGKRVLIAFGAPWCPWCHKLENWMATPEAAALLSKDFVIQKIDVDRTLGGKELNTKYCPYEGMGIPWFCVLDAEGNVLADSKFDAPKKPGAAPEPTNIGFPSTDPEIAAFVAALTKVAKNLTAEDISALQRSLVEVRERDKRAAEERAAAKGKKAS